MLLPPVRLTQTEENMKLFNEILLQAPRYLQKKNCHNHLAPQVNDQIPRVTTPSKQYIDQCLKLLREVDIDYGEWITIGMALHSNDPSPLGMAQYLYLTSGVSWKEDDNQKAESKWYGFTTHSPSDTNAISIRSLFFIMKKKGLKLPDQKLETDIRYFENEFEEQTFIECKEGGTSITYSKDFAIKFINNRNWVFIEEMGKVPYCKIEYGETGLLTYKCYSFDIFSKQLAPYALMQKVKDKYKCIPISKIWNESIKRKLFARFVFKQAGKEHKDELNLFTGLNIKTNLDGDSEFIHKLIKESLCNNNEKQAKWLLDWLAHILKRPWEKTPLIPVFITPPGAGKGLLFDQIVREILGPFFLKISSTDLSRQFNAHLANKFLTMIDEASLKNDELDRLKDLSGSSSINIEIKHGPYLEMENPSRYVITSNQGTSIKVKKNSRRFILFDGNPDIANKREFFDHVLNDIKYKFAIQKFAHDLLERDISQFNPYQKPSNIGGGFQTIILSYGEIGEFWYELLFFSPKRIYLKNLGLNKALVFNSFSSTTYLNTKESIFWKKSKELIEILGPDVQSTVNKERIRIKKVTPLELVKYFKETLYCPDEFELDEIEFEINPEGEG